VSVVGRAGKIQKSDARASLASTNPRFPRKPSATMLTYRLTGTREDIGIDHDEPDQSPPESAPPTRPTSAQSSRTMVRLEDSAALLTCINTRARYCVFSNVADLQCIRAASRGALGAHRATEIKPAVSSPRSSSSASATSIASSGPPRSRAAWRRAAKNRSSESILSRSRVAGQRGRPFGEVQFTHPRAASIKSPIRRSSG
jgi:hypothetical protein